MKKLLPLLLSLSLLFTFSACGDNEDEPKKEEEKPFVWEGDWNDPNDPNYKAEYGGKYNPIKGTWVLLKTPTLRFTYTEDFIYINEIYNKGTGNWDITISPEKYKINGTAFEYWWGIGRHIEKYKIVKENGKIHLLMMFPSDKEWTWFQLVK